MKKSSQSRSFAKQVQVDLLALSDADLIRIVHQWMDGSDSDVPEETRAALGYTRIPVEAETLPHLFYTIPETDNEGPGQWLSPSPHHLRALITAMDINSFAQLIITLAFQSLHTTYPEWHEGITFNAHLANSLRQMKR